MSSLFLIKNQLNKSGGLEKSLERIASNLIQKNYDLKILSSSTPSIHNPQISYQIFKTVQKPHFYQLLSFDQQTKNYLNQYPKAKILGFDRTSHQTHMRLGNGLHAAFLQKRALFDPFLKKTSYFLNPLHQTILYLEKKAFLNPLLEKILCNSSMVKEEILRFYPFVDPKKISVLHNGVEYQETEPFFSSWQEKKKELLSQYQIPSDKHLFLFVGNDFKRKGLGLLLKALTYLDPHSYQLLIVGQDKNENDFKKFALDHHLDKNVRFFGHQKTIYNFYIMADTCILPTYYDPFANITLEALAMGLFVITSPYNGGKEVLNSEIGAIIENMQDPQSLAYCLQQVLNKPKTGKSANMIRHQMINHDFSKQMNEFVTWLTK
jgi:UDP-glucose:(heptosyl)LPS alpha-1,3-glucosyltransferase